MKKILFLIALIPSLLFSQNAQTTLNNALSQGYGSLSSGDLNAVFGYGVMLPVGVGAANLALSNALVNGYGTLSKGDLDIVTAYGAANWTNGGSGGTNVNLDGIQKNNYTTNSQYIADSKARIATYAANGAIWQAMPVAPIQLACSQLLDGAHPESYTTSDILTNTWKVLNMLTNLADSGWTAAMTNRGTPLWISLDALGSLTITNGGDLDYNTNFFLENPKSFTDKVHEMGWIISHGVYVNGYIYNENTYTNTYYCAYNGSGISSKATSTLTDPSSFYGKAPDFFTPIVTLAEVRQTVWQFYKWGFDGVTLNDMGVNAKSYIEIQNSFSFNSIYTREGEVKNLDAWKYNFFGRKPLFVISFETMGQTTNLYSTPDLAVTRNGFLTDQAPSAKYGSTIYALRQLRYAMDNYPLATKANHGMFFPVGGQAISTDNATVSAIAGCPIGVWPDVVSVPTALNLVTNEWWQSIHNDPLQNWPRVAVDNGIDHEIALVKPLVDGNLAVAMFCERPGAAGTNFTVTWSQLGIPAGTSVNIWDVWNKVSLGTFKDSYTASMGAAQSWLLKFSFTNLYSEIQPSTITTNGQPFLKAFTDASDYLTYSNGFAHFSSLGSQGTNWLFDFMSGRGLKLNYSGATYYLAQDNNQGNGFLTSNYRPGSGIVDETQPSWAMTWGYAADAVRWYRGASATAGTTPSLTQVFILDKNGSVTIPGTNTAQIFIGNGEGLTNINVTNIVGHYDVAQTNGASYGQTNRDTFTANGFRTINGTNFGFDAFGNGLVGKVAVTNGAISAASVTTSGTISGNNVAVNGVLQMQNNGITGINLLQGQGTLIKFANGSQSLWTESISGLVNMTNSGIIISSNGISSYASNTLAPSSITFPASTVNWTNTTAISGGKNICVTIDNAGITGTVINVNGGQVQSTISATGSDKVFLQPNDYFSETYTVGTPTATWRPY